MLGASVHEATFPIAAHESAGSSPEELMGAFLDGNTRAFEALFRGLGPRVASALTRMSGDQRLAEDLCQSVFLKLYRARSSYERGMLLAPWVFAMARNTYLDHLRRSKRRPEQLSEDGTLPELAMEIDPASASSFEQSGLQECLGCLPESQRQALVLLKVEGLTVAEAAALCGTSPASIKMRAHRAYVTLRDVLAKQDPTRVSERRAGSRKRSPRDV
jgi:RNA polymerase sigma-70 factor (ECF subfamily)